MLSHRNAYQRRVHQRHKDVTCFYENWKQEKIPDWEDANKLSGKLGNRIDVDPNGQNRADLKQIT
jgi:hypothetical protein